MDTEGGTARQETQHQILHGRMEIHDVMIEDEEYMHLLQSL